MDEQLIDMLYGKFPKIFSDGQVQLAAGGTRAAIMCGDGWFDILDTLCCSLQFQTDRCGAPQVVATQIKEKFGALSFLRGEANDAQRGMISMAEAMSTRICETCGRPGHTMVLNSLRQTLCDEHAAGRP